MAILNGGTTNNADVENLKTRMTAAESKLPSAFLPPMSFNSTTKEVSADTGQFLTQADKTSLQAAINALAATLDGVTRLGQAAIPTIGIGGNSNIAVVYDRPFTLPQGENPCRH